MPSRPRKRAKPPKLYQFPYVRFLGKFYPLIPIALSRGPKSVNTFALLDSGASISVFRPEIAEALDIPSELRIVAVEEYGRIATWLAKRCNAPGEIRIYPQGSFRLGTVVLPTAFGDQYDIDLVFLRWIGKESTTQSAMASGAPTKRCTTSTGSKSPKSQAISKAATSPTVK